MSTPSAEHGWPIPPEGDPWAPAGEHIRVEFGQVHDCALHEGEPLHGDNGTWMSLGDDPEMALQRWRRRGDGHLVARTHVISRWHAIDPEQISFWTPQNLAGERKVDEHLQAGRVRVFDTAEDFVDSLDED